MDKPQQHPNHQALVEIDAELADLVPTYLSNRWADLASARQLLAQRDYEALGAIAHRIKGTAASYGFVSLGDIACALELAAGMRDPEAANAELESYDAFLRCVRIEYV